MHGSVNVGGSSAHDTKPDETDSLECSIRKFFLQLRNGWHVFEESKFRMIMEKAESRLLSGEGFPDSPENDIDKEVDSIATFFSRLSGTWLLETIFDLQQLVLEANFDDQRAGLAPIVVSMHLLIVTAVKYLLVRGFTLPEQSDLAILLSCPAVMISREPGFIFLPFLPMRQPPKHSTVAVGLHLRQFSAM
jgi:hypothetical protein